MSVDNSKPSYVATIEGSEDKLFFDYPLTVEGHIEIYESPTKLKIYRVYRQYMKFHKVKNQKGSYWLASIFYILREKK